MEAPQVTRELKLDELGRVELVDGPAGPAVRRVACGGGLPGSRWVAHILMRRERRALRRLEGLRGVAELPELPAYVGAQSPGGEAPRAADVLLRSWIEGEPLFAVTELPRDFFERLEDLVRELHDRGVCHNDLHKEPNILVQPDGRPALVDFQLASCHAQRGRRFRTRVAEDLRHVAKHRRVYALGTGLTVSARLPRRRSWLAALWMLTGKRVYNLVTRRILHTGGGEPRRPSAGPWPTWGPPVTPDRGSSRAGAVPPR